MMKRMMSLVITIAMIAVMAAMTTMNAFGAETNEVTAMADELAAMINEARAAEGLAPVYTAPEIIETAQIRAEESSMEYNMMWRNAGAAVEEIIESECIAYDYAAEILAAGTETAAETFAQWQASEEHWAAIMAADITHIGVGVYYDEDSLYGYYWQVTVVRTSETFADQYMIGAAETEEIAEGDITGDGYVDAFDYIALTEYIFNHETISFSAAQLERADCFRDGIITEADAKVMVEYILGQRRALPAVF